MSLIDTQELIDLDQNLTRILTHREPGKGDELLKESEFLAKNLDEVSDLIEKKYTEVFESYKKLKKWADCNL